MEEKFKPEFVFLIFAVLVGLFMVFFIPPFQSQDEPNHFKKAYSVATLKIFPSKYEENRLGEYLPCQIQSFINSASDEAREVSYGHSSYKYSIKEIKKLLQYEIDKAEQCFFNYPNTAIYSPFAYIPQSIGIFFASLFSQKILLIFLTSRVSNLLFFTLLCFYAIKTTRYLKWIFTIVLCCPMCIALASSLSADSVLISCCALFFAKILKAVSNQEYLNQKDIFILMVLSIIIALTKQSFWFLLLLLLIPRSRFKNNYISNILVILLPPFCLYILWSMYASYIMIPLNNADADSHIAYMYSHPFIFSGLILKTVFNLDVIYQAIGVLGWKSIYMSKFYYICYIIAIFANIFCTQSSNVDLNYKQKIFSAFIITFNVVLICATTFCFWTYKTTFSYIELQGRYLLPLVLPLLVLISSFVRPIYTRHLAIINTTFLIASGIYLTTQIVSIYF